METKAKVKLILGKSLTKEELSALKADIVNMEAQLGAPAPVPTPAPVKLKEVKTKDGKTLSVDGDIAATMPIMLIDPTSGPGPAPDGDYELADGTIVSVTGGLISVVKPGTTMPADYAKQIEAKFSAHKKEIENEYSVKLSAQKTEFENTIQELKKIVLSNSRAITKILETPIDLIEFNKNEKKYEDMTPSERYNHDNPILK